jgi:hypothetical protein
MFGKHVRALNRDERATAAASTRIPASFPALRSCTPGSSAI